VNKKKSRKVKGGSHILFGLIVAQQARDIGLFLARRKEKKRKEDPFHLAFTLTPSYCLILRD